MKLCLSIEQGTEHTNSLKRKVKKDVRRRRRRRQLDLDDCNMCLYL